MSIQRRDFNRYLLTGLAGGAGIGFAVGRYTKLGADSEIAPLAPVEALRAAADNAVGIHLLGLSIEGMDQLSLSGTERILLERLGLQGTGSVKLEELAAALASTVRRDYAEGRLAQAGEFVLSETERSFVGYALVRQGLHTEAYTPPEPELRDGIIAPGARFGPKFTVVGQIFNEQPDGHGGIWVMAENTPPGTVITVNGRKIKTTQKQKSLTGAIYDQELHSLIAEPSRHEIALLVPESGLRQAIGELEVRPRPPAATLENGAPSSVFCKIDKWSVKESGKGERIHVDTLCGPRSSIIYIGDVALTTRVKSSSIEGQFIRSIFTPGGYPLRLVDSFTGEAVSLGSLTID